MSLWSLIVSYYMNSLVYMRALSSQIDTNYTQVPETASFTVSANVHNPCDDTLSWTQGILAEG